MIMGLLEHFLYKEGYKVWGSFSLEKEGTMGSTIKGPALSPASCGTAAGQYTACWGPERDKETLFLFTSLQPAWHLMGLAGVILRRLKECLGAEKGGDDFSMPNGSSAFMMSRSGNPKSYAPAPSIGQQDL